MASSINASTSGAGGVITTADNTGILNLQTASTTAVTIDASQNVGIGTTSPTSFGANTHGITLDGTGNYQHITWKANGTLVADAFTNGTAGFFFGTEASVPLQFQTAATERMRIDSGGIVGIGTNNPAGYADKLAVYNASGNGWTQSITSASASGNLYGLIINYPNQAPNNTTSSYIYGGDSAAKRFQFLSNGGLQNYSANNTNLSDIREKKNIQLAGNYLDKICSIPVKTFLFNDQTDEELNLGVIAQDVQAVAPELVHESNWAAEGEKEKIRLSLYQTDLQYALMKCIQEQQTLIVSQSELINNLTARVTALEAK